MHRVVALVGIISTLRLSICLVDLPNLDKLMSRCRVKMTFILIEFKVAIIFSIIELIMLIVYNYLVQHNHIVIFI